MRHRLSHDFFITNESIASYSFLKHMQSLTNEEILLYSPAAPVPVQIRALVIAFKEHCAHGSLAHAGRFADKDLLLHRFPLPKI